MGKVAALVLMATWAVVAAREFQNLPPRLRNDDVTSMPTRVEASHSDKGDIRSMGKSHEVNNPLHTHDLSSSFTKRSVKNNKLLGDMLAGKSWPIDSHLFQVFLQDYVMRYSIEKVYFLHLSNGECIGNKILLIVNSFGRTYD